MQTLENILKAKTPQELFGDKAQAQRAYQRLLHIAHPDMYGDEEMKKVANSAFIHLNELWEAFNKHPLGHKPNDSNTIRTKKHEYTLGDKFYDADGVSYYFATYDAGHEKAVIVIPSEVQDNDLIESYSATLNKLKKEVNKKYEAFFPKYVEAFKFKINGQVKQLLAYNQPSNLFTLKQIQEEYPEGLHGRDLAWIFKRLLVAIGNTHEVGLVHGGINLDSVLIEPDQHGVLLTSWQYAVSKGEPLTVLPFAYKANYPSYVFEKKSTRNELDIMLAAKTMETLMRADTPKPLVAFFKGCQLNTLPSAGALLAEFDSLLERVYGEKKFHVFAMPRK
jgi:hypothetical protein